MLKSSVRSAIRLRGVRHNNLKNFDLDLPVNRLIVITGLSGSGKSSLAFDTLFAEGQRRYIETFSPYARQFFDRMDKPRVDSIEGIPPAIAIEQRNSVKTTRSTVGTMTEICDYMKTLWPHVAQLHCRQCGQAVRKDAPHQIWESLKAEVQAVQAVGNGPSAPQGAPAEFLITFDLPLTEKLSVEDCLGLVSKQGYQRLLIDGQVVRIDEAAALLKGPSGSQHASRLSSLTVVQDRLKFSDANRARFVEACEQAYHFGKGKLIVWEIRPPSAIRNPHFFSNRLHCAQCDIEYKEPSAALFSFNHPVGACPKCRGFGRVISIDYNLAVPDRSKTLAEGVVKPWQTGQGAECQTDLLRMCREMEIPINVPFNKLPKKWQELVIEGEPGYGEDEEHEWPRAWYGVKGYFRWLESKAYKMHVRVLLSRYRAYTTCPDCRGKRFQPEALLYRVSADSMVASPKSSSRGNGNGIGESAQEANQITLADFYHLPIRDALDFIEATFQSRRFQPNNPLGLVLNEVRSRLSYLNEVGLGYLTLDRPTRSLSGGETERVSLTTCLGTRLVNTLFVLDEPSVGLHPRDTERLVNILQQLRKTGNTVVVVEHEASVMRAADQIIDIGPGHGATGGEIVFQGTFSEVLKSKASLTGQYLSNRKQIEIPRRRPVRMMPGPATDKGRHPRSQATYNLNEAAAPYRTEQEFSPVLKLSQATRNNLQDLSVEIPLNRFVCVTGVSGSGKTTLVREVLLPALASELHSDVDASDAKASDRLSDDTNDNEDEDADPSLRAPTFALLEGAGDLQRVVLVDQSVLGKTPRSNPAVYIGAFDDIREFYAQSELAKQRGLNASAFSFNSGQGQCERCRGAGFEKIEMQFLSDVFVRCPDCDGRRYRSHILEIKISPKEPKSEVRSDPARRRNANGGVEVGRGAGSTVKANQKKSIPSTSSLSIADLLESTVEEVIGFLGSFPESRPARRALQSLQLLQEVGLGYLKLGQPINTLSGGESQRLKLVKHLADSKAGVGTTPPAGGQMTAKERVNGNESRLRTKETQSGEEPFAPTLFLFDEPTTGLHFDDVRVLLKVFQRLVDAGHSVMVIEHNLDVIKSADWVIDLGPDAGDLGGQIVAQGTPEEIAECPESHTGKALQEVLQPVTSGH